jgi:hypothetical protein
MGARRLIAALSVGTVLASMGCGGGDGVPKAQVRNNLSTSNACIVEAAWYDDAENVPYGKGYGWADAIAANGGQSSTREVVEGKGYAYAVVVVSSDCYSAADPKNGGVLYKTNDTYEMKAGQTTLITFSDSSAKIADATENWRFPRLSQVVVDAATLTD